MNKVILLIFSFLGTTALAQQTTGLEKDIYLKMDRNADTLFKYSNAFSVSIGIVKDGKIYTKHYGEIDKGKGNKANDNTYFEIASVCTD